MKLKTVGYLLSEAWEHFLLIPWFLLLTLRYYLYYFNNNGFFGRFISKSSRYFFKDVPYGKEERNIMDIYPPNYFNDGKHRVLLFIHGGGWISGNKHIYHYLGKSLSQKFKDSTVIVCNYRLCPKAFIEDQMSDIKKCIQWIYSDLNNYLISNKISHQSDFAKTDIELTVCGHSAGGHIILTSILDDPSFAKYIKNLICLATVYDLELQYEKEKTRGVEELSGLYRVMRGDLHKFSPVSMMRKSASFLLEQIHANNPDLNIFILHGKQDITVDLDFIHEFTDLYQNSPSKKCFLEKIILDDFNHSDFVKPLMGINFPLKKDHLLDLLSSIKW